MSCDFQNNDNVDNLLLLIKQMREGRMEAEAKTNKSNPRNRLSIEKGVFMVQYAQEYCFLRDIEFKGDHTLVSSGRLASEVESCTVQFFQVRGTATQQFNFQEQTRNDEWVKIIQKESALVAEVKTFELKGKQQFGLKLPYRQSGIIFKIKLQHQLNIWQGLLDSKEGVKNIYLFSGQGTKAMVMSLNMQYYRFNQDVKNIQELKNDSHNEFLASHKNTIDFTFNGEDIQQSLEEGILRIDHQEEERVKQHSKFKVPTSTLLQKTLQNAEIQKQQAIMPTGSNEVKNKYEEMNQSQFQSKKYSQPQRRKTTMRDKSQLWQDEDILTEHICYPLSYNNPMKGKEDNKTDKDPQTKIQQLKQRWKLIKNSQKEAKKQDSNYLQKGEYTWRDESISRVNTSQLKKKTGFISYRKNNQQKNITTLTKEYSQSSQLQRQNQRDFNLQVHKQTIIQDQIGSNNEASPIKNISKLSLSQQVTIKLSPPPLKNLNKITDKRMEVYPQEKKMKLSQITPSMSSTEQKPMFFDLIVTNLSVNIYSKTFGRKKIQLRIGKRFYRTQQLHGSHLLWVGKGYLFTEIVNSQQMEITLKCENDDQVKIMGKATISINDFFFNYKKSYCQCYLHSPFLQLLAVVLIGFQLHHSLNDNNSRRLLPRNEPSKTNMRKQSKSTNRQNTVMRIKRTSILHHLPDKKRDLPSESIRLYENNNVRIGRATRISTQPSREHQRQGYDSLALELDRRSTSRHQ